MAVPDRPVASVTVACIVAGPFAEVRVSQGKVTWTPLTVSVRTRAPAAERVKVLAVPEAPSTQMLTQTTPLTVAPEAGLVMKTFRTDGGELATVTVRLALAVRPAESVTVAVRVWAPLATVVVFQAKEAAVPV